MKNKDTLKKCIISRYDYTIKEPPFLTIKLDTTEVLKPQKDHLGEELARRLIIACGKKGYMFKFYTMSREKGFDYEIVVY